MRPDGFVSVDAGRLVTKPLLVEGGQLVINSAGTVTVSVRDADFQTLARTTVSGDSLQHAVRFGDKELAAFRSPRGVRLEFTIGQEGALYSFTVHRDVQKTSD